MEIAIDDNEVVEMVQGLAIMEEAMDVDVNVSLIFKMVETNEIIVLIIVD